MKQIVVLCEGQTEEAFVKTILSPFFLNKGIKVIPIVFATKTTATYVYRGGITKYEQVIKEIKKLSNMKNTVVTTMMDYYGFPLELEGNLSLEEKINKITTKLKNDVEQDNFYPNLIIHEFEMLIFTDLQIACHYFCIKKDLTKEIVNYYLKYPTPELINNSPLTAPSKRLKKLFPRYRKIIHGIEISRRIGLDKLKLLCPHFSDWLDTIEIAVES